MNSKRKAFAFLLLGVFLWTACNNPQSTPESATPAPISNPTNKVVLKSEVEWGALNPARGAKGPRAANLWGDRTTEGPTGFLVKFVGLFLEYSFQYCIFAM
jgi:hypothetical protein